MSDLSPDITSDELVALGVYDPNAPDAANTITQLRSAIRLGASSKELVEQRDSIGMLIASLQLRPPGGRYTLVEAAERAGVALDRAITINRISGFAEPKPDDRTFSEEDIELFRLFHAGSEVFDEAIMLQLGRVMGWAMSRVADAMVSAFATNVGTQSQSTDIDDVELARMNELAVSMVPSAVQAMEVVLRRHMQLRSRSDIPTGEQWEGVDAIDRAIGFCDLVGYTSLTEELSTRELAVVVADFENLAADVVTEGGGSVVKLIGDEVMFVALDPSAVAEIAFALVGAFERSDLPPVRVGLASGRVLVREGDYYGAVVNLAARIVKLAPPGGVLAPLAFRDSIGDAIVYEDGGAPALKGFETPIELARLHRA